MEAAVAQWPSSPNAQPSCAPKCPSVHVLAQCDGVASHTVAASGGCRAEGAARATRTSSEAPVVRGYSALQVPGRLAFQVAQRWLPACPAGCAVASHADWLPGARSAMS